MKLCKICHHHRRMNYPSAQSSYCRFCIRIKDRNWRKNHRQQYLLSSQRTHLKRKYGITPEEKDALFITQGRKCAACGSLVAGYTGNSLTPDSRWTLDHNHKTNKIRGVLCHSCNLIIGKAHESVSQLRGCAEYLERNQ